MGTDKTPDIQVVADPSMPRDEVRVESRNGDFTFKLAPPERATLHWWPYGENQWTRVVGDLRTYAAAFAESRPVDYVRADTVDHLADNLHSTQERCNALLEEARFARRERDAWATGVRRLIGLDPAPIGLQLALDSVICERFRQDAKWGPIGAPDAPQDALAVPFGTGGPFSKGAADALRKACDQAFDSGNGTWGHVLREECAEVLAETEPAKLRAELVQLAAVCVKLVEILDRKKVAP